MYSKIALGFVLIACLPACRTIDESQRSSIPIMPEWNPALPTGTVDTGPRRRDEGQGRSSRSAADVSRDRDVHRLPPYEVHERGFVDFGISIITNKGVAKGKAIEWMRVGGIRLGSMAERLGLNTGDDILAIDGALLSEVSRERMLEVFFQRERGDKLRLAVMPERIPLPRIVVLEAGR